MVSGIPTPALTVTANAPFYEVCSLPRVTARFVAWTRCRVRTADDQLNSKLHVGAPPNASPPSHWLVAVDQVTDRSGRATEDASILFAYSTEL